MQDFYQPYFEAVKQIVDGTPIQELDTIREQCNEAFLKAGSPGIPEQARSYTFEVNRISFAAEAENKILLGADPVEAYRGFKGVKPTESRQVGRAVLEQAVQQYVN